MLYYLFKYLDEIGLPGAGVFQYISFRAGLALIFSLVLSTIIGRRIINKLQKQQIGETIRDLGLEGQMQKKGTPTMGGIIIIASILLPVVLLNKLDNVYVVLMIVSTIWLGTIGFIDDYIKVFRKNKEGLAGRFKIIGQVGLGLIVAGTMYFNDGVIVREKTRVETHVEVVNNVEETETVAVESRDVKAPITSVPFFKNNKFDYRILFGWLGEWQDAVGWIFFALVVIFIITAVSNGANLTDGLDGLATGTSSIIGVTLAIFAYLSSHIEYANYLNIMFIPDSAELVIFIAAFIGSTVGFLWYNSYPAQVFMGDTGSLMLGGTIAVFAILIRIELLIPIMCGIFVVENVSVIMQTSYFKYTKKKFGEGRRIFLCAPLHHHYQKKGYAEPKIVTRFWLIGIILAVLTLVTLKIR